MGEWKAVKDKSKLQILLYSYLMTAFSAHRPTDRKLLGLNAFHVEQEAAHAAHLSAGTGVLQQH